LTPKQERFVAEYLIDLNATQAAIRAGYSSRSANIDGPRLLSNASVAAAVEKGKAEQLKEAGLSAARVLEEWRRLAFTDARSFWDDHGNLKPFSELTAEQGSALAGFEAVIKNAKAGDGITDTIHKIKLWDKVRVLESLGKHFGLLTERLEHRGEVLFRWQTPAEKS
jgi:phage terminase small subunit